MAENIYIFFQPEYVKGFKCSGQFCNARCCRNGWRICIDEQTFKNYEKFESGAKEITSHIKFSHKANSYVMTPKKGACPFLNEENLCTLQLKHGRNFLSEVCQTYPRWLNKVDAIVEYSLTLTCPIAARLALLPKTPMKFELVDGTISEDSKVKFHTPPLAATGYSALLQHSNGGN